jgi:hypothetical protein
MIEAIGGHKTWRGCGILWNQGNIVTSGDYHIRVFTFIL